MYCVQQKKEDKIDISIYMLLCLCQLTIHNPQYTFKVGQLECGVWIVNCDTDIITCTLCQFCVYNGIHDDDVYTCTCIVNGREVE